MNISLLRRGSAALAVGALASVGLVAAPAQAAPPGSFVVGDPGFTAGSQCTLAGGSAILALPLVDNGVPVTQSWSQTATVTKDDTPADITDLASSGTITASMTPLANGTATISATASVKSSAAPRQSTSACVSAAHSSGDVAAVLELPRPMWATVSATAAGNGFANVMVGSEDGGAMTGVAGRGETSSRILLPAGPVQLALGTESHANGNGDAKNRRGEATASFKIVLQPLGDATAPTGKGGGYAQFGARDCATGNVAAAITKKAKKKAKQVVITVNGAKVAKFKGKKLKKRALVLPAAPASAAEVVATIKLKNGKKVTVTRSYLACS